MNTIHPLDPCPFTLLNLLVSLETIVLTSVVLMTSRWRRCFETLTS